MTIPTDGRRAVFAQALAKAEADKADAERRIAVYQQALQDLAEIAAPRGFKRSGSEPC